MQQHAMAMDTDPHAAPPAQAVSLGAARFAVLRHPLLDAALAEFRSESEAGTRQFFEAALPLCDRMIDVGGHVGLTALYAANLVGEVDVFEPSPVNAAFLQQNLALNPALSGQVRLHRLGLSDREEEATLYAKGFGDSGSSLFQDVERGSVVQGRPVARIRLRDARAALGELGVTPRTLLKIDIEGAEYRVVPAIRDLLAAAKPFLHLSFHPFNLVVRGEDYETTLLRLARSCDLAAALASYRHMYFHRQGRWLRIDQSDRMDFLLHYLLAPKPQPALRTAQYGFVDAAGFSDVPLPALDA
jgi:FkbM family methyltransferase